MPALLNNAALSDLYTPGTTVTFPGPRPRFSLNITNAAVYYQLYFVPPGQNHTRDLIPDPSGEHYLTPSFNNFSGADHEGAPEGSRFGGIGLRNASPVVANVTVL